MTPPGEASPTAAVPPPLPGPPPLPAPGPPPVITLPAASPPPIPPGSAPSGARIGLVAAAAMLLSAPVLGALGGALVFNVLLPRVVLARQAGVAPIAPGPPDPPATGSGDPP